MGYDTLMTILGVSAAAGTILQSTFGLGGQLLRLRSSTEIEVRGISLWAFAGNAASHSIWAAWALGTANLIVLAPNLVGGVISAAIVLRVIDLRRGHAEPA